MDGIAGSSVWGLVDALSPSTPKQPTETTGTITRVDPDGSIWVTPNGGTTEMPIRGTYSEGSLGDAVKVSVSGGRASIVGNSTSPSVGAIYVGEVVKPVSDVASEAYDAASRAKVAADSAEADAQRAQESATTAGTAAVSALTQLATVEDVVNVLEWIVEHSVLTEDTTATPGKQYYVKDSETGVYTRVVTIPDGANPQSLGWYEIQDAVTDYIGAHLAITDYGLNLVFDGTIGRIHLGTVDGTKPRGTYLIDASGAIAASFGEGGVTVGPESGFHVTIGSTELGFWQGPKKVAYVTNNELYITEAAMPERMRVGQWALVQRNSGNMGVFYVG